MGDPEHPKRTVTEPIETVPLSGESSYVGALIDGRYKILRLIGRGGMGSVYEVEQVHMQKRLAMKLLHEDMVVRKQLVGRFTREARAVSRLNSPHTVRVYDFGRHKALFFLVMECLDGQDLEVVLSQVGPLHWRRALRILAQVCEALEEAHREGIIHRDLKPENIMILSEAAGEDFVKVLDFGLAKITEDANDVFSVHSHRDLFGTPYYMSPEQIRSEEIDSRVDVYALGCLLYRMLTNQHVYDAPYAFEVLRKHLTEAIPSVCRARPDAGIPPRVDRLVWRAMAKRPNGRFPDIEKMREEVLDCLENPGGESLISPGVPLDPGPPLEIDRELEERLRSFEQSHREAEARMGAESDSVLPMGIPVDSAIDEVPFEPQAPDTEDPAPGFASAPHASEGSDSNVADPDLLDLDFSDDLHSVPETDFSRRLRSQRRWRKSVAWAFLTVSLAAAAWFVFRPVDTVVANVESEPNNTLATANPIENGQSMEGRLGDRHSVFESDMDLYRLSMGDSGRFLNLELSGIDNVDLVVEVLDGGGRSLMRLNHGGIGRPETLHRLRVPTRDVVLMVTEHRSEEVPPSEHIEAPYALTAHVLEELEIPGEVEPNDNEASANTYTPGHKIAGHLDGIGDVDYYRIETDSVLDLRRWDMVVEAQGGVVPRVSLYRLIGDTVSTQLFSDQGRAGTVQTTYEESVASGHTYFVAVAHSGRGADAGTYRFVTELLPARPRIAHEPNDDRARATRVHIGEAVHGSFENTRDVDVFAIPVTDPQHRSIEIEMDEVFRGRVRLTLSGVNAASTVHFPRVEDDRDRMRAPQPHTPPRTIRFGGEGETYYLSVRPRRGRRHDGGYSFRVVRVMKEETAPAVGGPGY